MSTASTSGNAPDEPHGPEGEPATYLIIDGFKAFWHADQPDRIHLATSDPRFLDEHGAKPGIRIVFSSNSASADFNPANFNRVARALEAVGAPAPAEVPLSSRKLKDRGIAANKKQVPPTPPGGGTVTDPGAYGWVECPTCSSIVVSLEAHQSAVH